MSMNIKELLDAYAEKDREWERERQALLDKIVLRNQQVKRLERRLSKLGMGPYWIDEIIRPLADELVKHLPGRTVAILGPFGIGCRTAIHFYRDGVEGEERCKGTNCISITFEPNDLTRFQNSPLSGSKLSVVDYSVNTHRYSVGTMGQMNGLNHPVIPVPEDADIEWFLSHVDSE